jgi:hypothetical protein
VSHHNRIRSATDAWANITFEELQQFEILLSACINGGDGTGADGGSTHAPSNPIIIAGPNGLIVTGPTVVAYAGLLQTDQTSAAITSPTIQLLDGDWPELDPSNVNNAPLRLQPCMLGKGLPSFSFVVREEVAGLQAIAPMFDLSDGLGMRPARAHVGLKVHDGATITSVSVTFHVSYPHTSMPTTMPSVRVLRYKGGSPIPFAQPPPDTGTAVALTSSAAGADLDGFVYVPKPSSAAAWTNAFQQQTLEVPCDQNNVVDCSQYSYLVELVDEQGLTGWPWQVTFLQPVEAATFEADVEADMLAGGIPSAFDTGITLGDKDFVLVKDQSNPNENGIYKLSSSAPWTRIAVPFTQGFIVPVLGGSSFNGGTLWQASSLISSWDSSTIHNSSSPNPIYFVPQSDNPFPVEGQALIAHGLLWQALLVQYANVPDMRPD